MEKVYCVFINKGSWETWEYLDKVFSNKEKADEYAKSINDRFAELKSLLPIDESYNDDFDDNKYDEYMDKLVKKMEEFKNTYNINTYNVKEFNEAIVSEFEIN